MRKNVTRWDENWKKSFDLWRSLRDPHEKKTKEWCRTQRRMLNGGTLLDWRRDLLKAHGFDFKEGEAKSLSPGVAQRVAQRRAAGVIKSKRQGVNAKKWINGLVLYLHFQALQEIGRSKEIPDENRKKSMDWYGAQKKYFKKNKRNALDSVDLDRLRLLQAEGVILQHGSNDSSKELKIRERSFLSFWELNPGGELQASPQETEAQAKALRPVALPVGRSAAGFLAYVSPVPSAQMSEKDGRETFKNIKQMLAAAEAEAAEAAEALLQLAEAEAAEAEAAEADSRGGESPAVSPPPSPSHDERLPFRPIHYKR